jgi:NAD(P)-dependent dehydrogenase (short-subunit alcohol dehydrogenase family)
MSSSLAGRAGFVTGAASGIGRASALAFAAAGARVVVADVDDDGGRATAALIAAADGEAHFVHCDVTDESHIESLVAATTDRFGRLDWAHNNAGIAPQLAVPIAQQERSWWDQVLAVDLMGVLLCMKHEIRQFVSQGTGGAIVNTSSMAGLAGQPNLSSYVAAKWAVNGLTKCAALEVAADGIRVNAICPHMTSTPGVEDWVAQNPEQAAAVRNAIPLGRIATAGEQAAAAVWLCSDEASYVTGVLLPVNGGLEI